MDDVIPREERYENYVSIQKDLKNSILTGKNGTGGVKEILLKYRQYILRELNIEYVVKEKEFTKKLLDDIDQCALQKNIRISTVGILCFSQDISVRSESG